MPSVAPVCHIPSGSDKSPQGPTPINKSIPAVPPPATTDPQQMQYVINQMRQIIIYMTGQGGGSSAPAKQKPARWQEAPGSRVVKTQRIFQNNDKTSSNWVDVQVIQQITMQDGVTGESWVWKAGDLNSGS